MSLVFTEPNLVKNIYKYCDESQYYSLCLVSKLFYFITQTYPSLHNILVKFTYSYIVDTHVINSVDVKGVEYKFLNLFSYFSYKCRNMQVVINDKLYIDLDIEVIKEREIKEVIKKYGCARFSNTTMKFKSKGFNLQEKEVQFIPKKFFLGVFHIYHKFKDNNFVKDIIRCAPDNILQYIDFECEEAIEYFKKNKKY